MHSQTILIVDDDRLQRWGLREHLEHWGYAVLEAESVETATAAYRRESPDLVLLDLKLGTGSGLDVLREIKGLDPAAAVIMVTGHGEIDDVVDGFRMGLADFFRKPLDLDALRIAVRYRLDAQRLQEQVDRAQIDRARDSDIIGDSPGIREAVRLLEKVAVSGATSVLLQGESGTGKDLFAKVLHDRSNRRTGPFIAVNCAALPDALLESELFGHERGAFTDARSLKKGVFEIADGGTLYLDEIGELKLPLQAKLLRVLETMTFRRVGGLRDISVDTRVVAASNRNLPEAVQAGQFRADLFYRLAVIQVTLPPLRERRNDIPALVRHLVARLSANLRRRPMAVSPRAMEALTRYDWPGNVRELRNALERVIILEDGDTIATDHLPAPIVPAAPDEAFPPVPYMLPSEGISLELVEEHLVRQAMALAEGNQTRAARLLAISRDALRYKLKKFGMLAGDGEPPS